MAQTTFDCNGPPFAAADIATGMAALRPLFDRHAPGDGFFPAPIAGLQLIRASAPSEPLSAPRSVWW